MKKEWTKPKLIRLYSGRPDEAILAVCADSGGATTKDVGGWDCGPSGGVCSDVAS